MATMKENKGKEVMDEGVKSQPRPPISEKRKNISSRVDLGDLLSRRGRDKKHKSSKPQDVKSPPALIWSLQYKFLLLILSLKILRPRRSRLYSMHPHCLPLPRKFLSTS